MSYRFADSFLKTEYCVAGSPYIQVNKALYYKHCFLNLVAAAFPPLH
jgi:hypothetical protein